MEDLLAIFILGIAVGIRLYHCVMYFVMDCCPDIRCAYCKWRHIKRGRHP